MNEFKEFQKKLNEIEKEMENKKDEIFILKNNEK
jgi:tetrahydromethanopterin S-methyltransferase subunit G